MSRNRQPTLLERWGADGISQDSAQHFFIARYAEAYAAELDHFITALETGVSPSIGFKEGRLALTIAFAAMQSAKSGRPIAMDPPA